MCGGGFCWWFETWYVQRRDASAAARSTNARGWPTDTTAVTSSHVSYSGSEWKRMPLFPSG